MKRILPLHQPIIQHSPANAYLFSIIGEEPDEFAWIMNNFVNLRYNLYTHYDDFFRNDMWYNCYHITETRFTQEFINQFSDDAFDIIKKLINEGFYVYMYVNTRYIRIYNKEKDYWHNALIYGYDEEKDLVYLADFFDENFGTGTCTSDELRRAYPYPENKEGFYYDLWNRAIKRKKEYQYQFDLKKLYIKLKDYVNGTDINASQYYTFDSNDIEDVEFDHFEEGYEYVYGNSIYDAMCTDLLKDELKVRALHLILEFESLMCKRIQFLEEKKYLKPGHNLCEESAWLRKEAEIIRNLFMKYKFADSFNEERKKRICDRIMELKKREKCLIDRLLENLLENNTALL